MGFPKDIPTSVYEQDLASLVNYVGDLRVYEGFWLGESKEIANLSKDILEAHPGWLPLIQDLIKNDPGWPNREWWLDALSIVVAYWMHFNETDVWSYFEDIAGWNLVSALKIIVDIETSLNFTLSDRQVFWIMSLTEDLQKLPD